MRVLLTCLLALGLLTVETVLVKYLELSVARIDVTVVLIAFLALRAALAEGTVAAFGVGYLLDLMSGGPTGLYTFLAVFVFLLGRFGENWVDVRSPGAFMLFAMAMDGLHGTLARFFAWMSAKGAAAVSIQLGSLSVQVLLTGAAAIPIFYILRRLDWESGHEPPGLLGR